MYESRVSIPSREGTFTRILAVEQLPAQIQDDVKNAQTLSVALVLWTSLLGDSPILDRKPNRVIARFVASIQSDPYGTIRFYAELKDQLLTALVGSDVSQHSFNDELFRDFKRTPVFREFHAFTKSGSPELLQYLLSFLEFPKGVVQDRADLKTEALRQWFEVEGRLENLVLPEWVASLRKLSDVVFSDWHWDDFIPKHGPGYVREKVRLINEKNSLGCAIPTTVRYLYMRGDWEPTVSWADLFPGAIPITTGIPLRSLSSRLTFVPKDYKKMRSICMEPVWLQWSQQGILRSFSGFFERSHYLHRHVKLADQIHSQEQARLGSQGLGLDTIDLSSASDSVHSDLVRAVFPPKVLKHLLATRSSAVELPDGNKVNVHKFAPMGSAVCFPVQTTVFSLVNLYIGICYAYGRDWNQPNALDGLEIREAYRSTFKSPRDQRESRLNPFSVYGDDIICDNRVTSNIILALSQLGFSVNTEKSFTGGSSFRESCGGYFYRGVNVTPFRLSLKQFGESMTIDVIAGLADNANLAFDMGFRHLRRHIIAVTMFYPILGRKGKHIRRQRGKNPILFSVRPDNVAGEWNQGEELAPSLSIWSENPVNDHLQGRKWQESGEDTTSHRYQRNEVRSIGITPSRKDPINSDAYRMTTWWRERYRTVVRPGGPTPAAADSREPAPRWRWTPT
jgi:hypothetical protein